MSIDTILGFHTTEPSSEGMLAKICARDVTEDVPEHLRELYVVLEDTTDPLDMVERSRTFLNALRAKKGMTKAAVPALGEDVVVGERDDEEEDGEGGIIALAKKDHALIKGEMVATTLSPTILMCSTLEVCSTSHVDALNEGKEGGALAFEEAVRSFLLVFMPLLALIPPHGKCHALTDLSNDQMLRSLGGADANQMKSMTLEMPQTHTLAEIHVSGDIALGSVDECALSLASVEAVRY